MENKKDGYPASTDEWIERAKQVQARQHQRNARQRQRRQWLKQAPREETTLRAHAPEQPCSISLYLQAEHVVLQQMETVPQLKKDALIILLTLAHTILHLLSPEKECRADTTGQCSVFSQHTLCLTALEILRNYRLDPAFHLIPTQKIQVMSCLLHGLDPERLGFEELLGDLPIDL